VVVTGARGAYRIDPATGWTSLVVDETALPAVGTILDESPAGSSARPITPTSSDGRGHGQQ
jgi:NADPH-dependent ferric siderophore reductase